MTFLNSDKLPFVLAFFVGLMYVSPWLLLGDSSYVLIHDNLDSNVLWFKTLIEDGHIFSNNLTVIENFMGGTPRLSFGSEFNVILWLYYFFDPYTAYVVNQLAIRLVAFYGMYVLLVRYVMPATEERLHVVMIATLFALLPFWPSGGLTVAGLPLATYAFLNIRGQVSTGKDWLAIVALPFYSSLILSFMFFISLAFIVWLYDFIKGRRNIKFLLAILLFSAIYLGVEYRLVISMLFDTGYQSHRIERLSHYVDFTQALIKGMKHFWSGQYHAASVHTLLIPVVVGTLAFQLYTQKVNRVLLLLIILNILISLWYGLWKYEGWKPIKEHLNILQQLNLSRYHFLAALIWYAAFAVALHDLWARYGKKIRTGVWVLFVLQAGVLFYESDFVHEWRKHGITYKAFFAQEQFADIKAYLDDLQKNKPYRVASLGIHPTIALYNGFATIDGYSANYPLQYKHEFRKIIRRELEGSDRLRHSYDDWGSRVYMFSEALGYSFLYTKEKAKPVNVHFDAAQMKKMGCYYVLSSVPIRNPEQNGFTFLKEVESNESAWRIRVYRVNAS
jgi:hypothetical protein